MSKIITNYEARNYAYIAYTADDLEQIIFVADTMQEMADWLGITLSGVSRLVSRKVIYPTRHIRVARVKIYDYVYIAYEKTISEPIYVARDPYELRDKFGINLETILGVLYNRHNARELIRKKEKKVRQLFGKYYIKRVDLLELDQLLATFLRKCLKSKDPITEKANDEVEYVQE